MSKRLRILILAFCVIFNLAGWVSSTFADWYTGHIFPLWGKTYGRLTSLVPFSVGEWAIILGLVWLAVLFVRFLWALPALRAKRQEDVRRRLGRMPALTLDLLVVIALVMSLNCFILYHCSPIDRNLESRSYSTAELTALRDLIVEECNERAVSVPRDEAGQVIFNGPLEEEARRSINRLGERLLPRLAGYSVRPKTFVLSDFVSQQYICGYYFPFTMEANVNGRMEILNTPFTMCHELAHTHGYLYEDEANLIGFLACLTSDDPAFVYSGYLGVLYYIDNDFYASVDRETYKSHPAIDPQVRTDNLFLTEESWAAVEKNSPLDTELVHHAADVFIDQNQKLNGVAAGKASYTHVVKLLLSYYSQNYQYTD